MFLPIWLSPPWNAPLNMCNDRKVKWTVGLVGNLQGANEAQKSAKRRKYPQRGAKKICASFGNMLSQRN